MTKANELVNLIEGHKVVALSLASGYMIVEGMKKVIFFSEISENFLATKTIRNKEGRVTKFVGKYKDKSTIVYNSKGGESYNLYAA